LCIFTVRIIVCPFVYSEADVLAQSMTDNLPKISLVAATGVAI
jgi:hypothetical protein